VTIPVEKSQETQYNFDQAASFVNRFWGRRPDWVAINKVFILEFKQSTDRNEGFLEVKRSRSK